LATAPASVLIGWPLLSVTEAVVSSADLTIIGDQVGCFWMSSAPRPAMCGLDIDVPDTKS
jgi:hypothetical protein